jgi:GTP cyclohydrolase I
MSSKNDKKQQEEVVEETPAEPDIAYVESINGLEPQRDQLIQQLNIAQSNELVLSRELQSYLIRERDMLRGALNNQ